MELVLALLGAVGILVNALTSPALHRFAGSRWRKGHIAPTPSGPLAPPVPAEQAAPVQPPRAEYPAEESGARLRVFISADPQEVASERAAAVDAVTGLRLLPEIQGELERSHVFIGIYWNHAGPAGTDASVSRLEEEYRRAGDRPKLIYLRTPAEREHRLKSLLERIQRDDQVSYKPFKDAAELHALIVNDLALLLTERFEEAPAEPERAQREPWNLPTPLTPLVGRDEALAHLETLLLREGLRQVTLVGPGGVGKSRLAIELTRLIADAFPDGVAFVDLVPVQSSALLPQAIAQALGLRESGSRPWQESLETYLHERRFLLVLDNFEHVLDAAPLVAGLLTACARLTILVTSRATLRLSWEHAVQVTPLRVPDLARSLEPEPLERIAAVTLFRERARAVKSDFTLTRANARAVAEICVMLDGLPLAIELAAARVRLLSPEEILARLRARDHHQKFQILGGGARDLPARQQALRHTIAWSYDLLEAHEQQLFRRLAVFVDGFTLQAAEALIGSVDAAAAPGVLDGLGSLIEKSLLRDAAQAQDGELRFAMLATIREYAFEQLEASGELDILAREHAHCFLALAEQAKAEGTGSAFTHWHERLASEHDNLRAALATLRRLGDDEASLQLAGALASFWADAGYLSDGRAYLEEVLGRSATAPATWTRARALHGAGVLAWHQGDFSAAHAHFERSVALWRELSDERHLPRTLNRLGYLLVEMIDHKQATAIFEESVEICRRRNDRQGLAWSLKGLATAALHRGDLTATRLLLDEALELARSVQDERIIIWTLHLLGDLAIVEGKPSPALAHYHEAVTLLKQERSQQERSSALHSLGWVVCLAGDTAWASALFEESLAQARESGDKRQVAWSLNHLGDVARLQGRDETAEAFYIDSLTMFREMQHHQGIASVQHNRGYLALRDGDQELAGQRFLESLTLFEGIGHRWSAADSLSGLAALATESGRPRLAARLYGAAAAHQEAIDKSGIQNDPANLAERERYTARARGLIGEAGWNSAWAEGRAMTLEQAVGCARSAYPSGAPTTGGN